MKGTTHLLRGTGTVATALECASGKEPQGLRNEPLRYHIPATTRGCALRLRQEELEDRRKR
jgi:hypothetical protein